MRRSFFPFLFLLVALVPARADTTPEQYRSIVENTIAQYLRPEFETLQTRAAALAEGLPPLCQVPDQANLDVARGRFSDVLAAWSRVEYARIGPVIEAKRLERFSFWPDPKGIGLRQVQKLLADEDETATDQATLKGKSVAVQGLQALEFILYGTGSEALAAGDDYRCRYASAIGANLLEIAQEIAAGWNDEDGYAALMRSPGPDNAVYRNDGEVAGDIVEILTTGFQFLRDVKLGFVGENPEKSKPRQAAFWRSGQTMNAIRANFEGLQRLWEVSGLKEVLATRPGGPGIVDSIDFEFRTAFEDLNAGFRPVEEAVTDAKEHNRLNYLSIVANSLWSFLAEDTMGLLGLRIGFNALDGD